MSDFIPDPELIQKLAVASVRAGLNLQPGQDLVLTSPVVALPLARAITAEAYKAGAGLVTVLLSDDGLTLARYENATDESFDKAPNWLMNGMKEAFAAGAARLAIYAEDPQLLAGQNPDHVSRAAKAHALAYKPAAEYIAGMAVNWNIVSYPAPAWAARVFPDLSPNDATAKLSDAIFAASRVTGDDPVADWKAHAATLAERVKWLNDHNFDALNFRAEGTDLTVAMGVNHRWLGGAVTAQNGISAIPNIPTEEVFTTPDARRTSGYVRASKPLALQGNLVEGIEMTFEEGRAVKATATKGQDLLQELISRDEGAARLGEVALVPHKSPISESGILFLNTLFDENAACHIAMGRAYATAIEGGQKMTQDELADHGANDSIIHVDWMIGTPDMEIDGIGKDGSRTPVFWGGNWA